MIPENLLQILICPETKQKLSIAQKEMIDRLNGGIRRGHIKNRLQKVVTQTLDGGLLREDQKIIYPIRNNIPVLLMDEGIPL